MAYRGTAVLPVGGSMNPLHPQTAEYFDSEQVCYVMFKLNEARTRPTRVLTSFGNLGSAWKLGTEHELYHDQTGAQMGDYRVVGIHDFSSGEMAGEVPDMAIKHAVFK